MEVKKFLKLNNPNDQIKEMSSTKMQKETEVLKSAKRYKTFIINQHYRILLLGKRVVLVKVTIET